MEFKAKNRKLAENSARCDCCPFGFHIDIDFVDFSTDSTAVPSTYDYASPSNDKFLSNDVTKTSKIRPYSKVKIAPKIQVTDSPELERELEVDPGSAEEYYRRLLASECERKNYFSPDHSDLWNNNLIGHKFQESDVIISPLSSEKINTAPTTGGVFLSDSLENLMSDFDETLARSSSMSSYNEPKNGKIDKITKTSQESSMNFRPGPKIYGQPYDPSTDQEFYSNDKNMRPKNSNDEYTTPNTDGFVMNTKTVLGSDLMNSNAPSDLLGQSGAEMTPSHCNRNLTSVTNPHLPMFHMDVALPYEDKFANFDAKMKILQNENGCSPTNTNRKQSNMDIYKVKNSSRDSRESAEILGACENENIAKTSRKAPTLCQISDMAADFANQCATKQSLLVENDLKILEDQEAALERLKFLEAKISSRTSQIKEPSSNSHLDTNLLKDKLQRYFNRMNGEKVNIPKLDALKFRQKLNFYEKLTDKSAVDMPSDSTPQPDDYRTAIGRAMSALGNYAMEKDHVKHAASHSYYSKPDISGNPPLPPQRTCSYDRMKQLSPASFYSKTLPSAKFQKLDSPKFAYRVKSPDSFATVSYKRFGSPSSFNLNNFPSTRRLSNQSMDRCDDSDHQFYKKLAGKNKSMNKKDDEYVSDSELCLGDRYLSGKSIIASSNRFPNASRSRFTNIKSGTNSMRHNLTCQDERNAHLSNDANVTQNDPVFGGLMKSDQLASIAKSIDQYYENFSPQIQRRHCTTTDRVPKNIDISCTLLNEQQPSKNCLFNQEKNFSCNVGSAVEKEPCIECENFKRKLQMVQFRPVSFDVATSTDQCLCQVCLNQRAKRWRSVFIDATDLSTKSETCEVCSELRLRTFVGFGVNTDDKSTSCSATSTDFKKVASRMTSTEAIQCNFAGTNTEPPVANHMASFVEPSILHRLGYLNEKASYTDHAPCYSVGFNTDLTFDVFADLPCAKLFLSLVPLTHLIFHVFSAKKFAFRSRVPFSYLSHCNYVLPALTNQRPAETDFPQANLNCNEQLKKVSTGLKDASTGDDWLEEKLYFSNSVSTNTDEAADKNILFCSKPISTYDRYIDGAVKTTESCTVPDLDVPTFYSTSQSTNIDPLEKKCQATNTVENSHEIISALEMSSSLDLGQNGDKQKEAMLAREKVTMNDAKMTQTMEASGRMLQLDENEIQLSPLAEEEEDVDICVEEFDENDEYFECSSDESNGSSTPAPYDKKFDFTKPRPTRAFQLSRAAATKKLLLCEKTSHSQDFCANKKSHNRFHRTAPQSQSLRLPRSDEPSSVKIDSLRYITEKNRKLALKSQKPICSEKSLLLKSNSHPRRHVGKPLIRSPKSIDLDDHAAGLVEKVATTMKSEASTDERVRRRLSSDSPISNAGDISANRGRRLFRKSLLLEDEEASDTLGPLPSEFSSLFISPAISRVRSSKVDQCYDNLGASPEIFDQSSSSVTFRSNRLIGDLIETPSMPETTKIREVHCDGTSTDESNQLKLRAEPFCAQSDSDAESDDANEQVEGSYDLRTSLLSAKCDISTPGDNLGARRFSSDNLNDAKASETTAASFFMSEALKEACAITNGYLLRPTDFPANVKPECAQQFLQHEWLKAAARRNAGAKYVEDFLDCLEAFSRQLLHKVVNMADQNENTALHYAVSHCNFDVVSLLLDTKVCNLNRPNKAGYTPVMLAALCQVFNQTDGLVVQRLFEMGDVNIKASQHGQTALMLAVSHGKIETTKMLIEAGAGLNIQDEDGSTALMCAAEHGHLEIVRLLLVNPEIDASLTDYDGSTALSIAVENGNKDIGVLIYAHLNYGNSSLSANSQSTSIWC